MSLLQKLNRFCVAVYLCRLVQFIRLPWLAKPAHPTLMSSKEIQDGGRRIVSNKKLLKTKLDI